MTQEIKPCPFCGESSGLSFEDGSTHRWGVASCNSCGASAGETRREYPDNGEWHAAAIEQWNTRNDQKK
jgi:Lar family restriction alleviation protein